MDQMKQSSDGSAIIDITKEFEHLFARNIIHIAFGEDITHYELDVWMREDIHGTKPMTKRRVNLYTAMQEIFDQTLTTMITKLKNPLFLPLYYITGKGVPFTVFEQRVQENSQTLRAVVRDYVNDRKFGRKQSHVEGSSDLLSLLLKQDESIFPLEAVVDEMIDFFIAGAQTTQLTTQTMVSHFATDTESLERVRSEFEGFKSKQIKSDQSLKDLDSLTFLDKVIDFNSIQNLNYTHCFVNETLRF